MMMSYESEDGKNNFFSNLISKNIGKSWHLREKMDLTTA